jgi:lipopolysaccharide export system permease protein
MPRRSAAVAYYALLRFGEGLSQQGVLPAWLGPNLPNAAFAAVGAALTALIARRGPEAVR